MQGKELKNWRKNHNLTQMELAQHLHVDRITVWRWEVELRTIPPFLFLALEALENRLREGGERAQTKIRKTKSRGKEVKRYGKFLPKR
jgi:DNA-binding XRE family transcriptional regulator